MGYFRDIGVIGPNDGIPSDGAGSSKGRQFHLGYTIMTRGSMGETVRSEIKPLEVRAITLGGTDVYLPPVGSRIRVSEGHVLVIQQLDAREGFDAVLLVGMIQDEKPVPVPCTTQGCPGDGRYAAPGKGHMTGCRYPHDNFRLDEDSIRDAARQAAKAWNAIRTTRSPYEGFKAGYEKAMRDVMAGRLPDLQDGTRCAWCGEGAVRAMPSDGIGITYPSCGNHEGH